MLDPMDFKELDRITDALRQWFVSQGFEDEREHLAIVARLCAQSIFKAGPQGHLAFDEIKNKKADLRDLVTAMAQVAYYENQAALVAKFIKTDLVQMHGWRDEVLKEKEK